MLCISAAYAVMRCLSVCPSVCLLRSWIMSKQIKISSKFFHHQVAPHSSFSVPNGVAIFRREPPLTGASNAGGINKKCDSGRISGFAAYRSTVLSTTRVAKCENKAATDGGERRSSSTHRGVRRPLFTQEDDEVLVTGSTLYAGDEGKSNPPWS